MFIFPLIVINVINSDKFIAFKNDFINDLLKKTYCYMDGSSDSNTIRNSDESNRTVNRIDTGSNRITISNDEVRTANTIVTSNNVIEIEHRNNTNNFNIDNLQINNTIRPSASTFASASQPSLSTSILDGVDRLQNTRNVSSSTNLLEENNQNRTRNRFNVNKIRKFKSVIEFKNKLSQLLVINKPSKITSADFPFNENNIFKIPNNIILKNLESSINLNSFLIDNNVLLFRYNNNGNIIKYINSIVNDSKLYLDTQQNVLTLINNPNKFELYINSIKQLIITSNLFYVE
jgi:hypothetical protein